jgi:two-component system sensor histidine kinase PilS (NtrC family)
MLKNRDLPQEIKDKLMEIAISEMDRLDSIISDFLIYSRPKPPEKHLFCLSSTARDILQTFSTSEPHITVNATIKDDIYINADEEKIRQLLWNLLKNAKEAIEEKEGHDGTIEVSLQRDNPQKVVLTISDNGCGMTEDTLEKIFFPFFSTKDKGTGLGLSVVDRIVQEHNGKIIVESNPEKGTRFTIILPGDNNEGENSNS